MVGVPGRIVKRDNVAIPKDTLDQVHLPDPVMDDINRLSNENKQLKARLDELEKCLENLK